MAPEKETLRLYIFTCMNSDTFPWRHLLVVSTFSTWQDRPQRLAMVWSTKHSYERECRRAGEARYSRWPTYLSSRNNLNLLPFTGHNSRNYPWRTQYEKGVCKVGTPLPDRGTNMERVRCAKQMLAMSEPQWPKWLTDVVTGARWNFHKRLSLYGMPSK